jgi:arabinofuranan 3-O-arabinosyltransferase
MGQSLNAGWVASVNGHALDAPTLVDGFANGWQIDPAVIGTPPGNGVVTVDLRWAPQSRVDIGLLVSLLAILLCLVLVFLPRRWRRAVDRAEVRADGEDAPRLLRPFVQDGRPATVRLALVIGVITGMVAGVISAPVTGAIVGVATGVALLVPRLRMLLGVAAVGCVLAAGIYVVAHQGSAHVTADGAWPSHFELASSLTWAGIVFLGADATVEVFRRWRGPPGNDGAGTAGTRPPG